MQRGLRFLLAAAEAGEGRSRREKESEQDMRYTQASSSKEAALKRTNKASGGSRSQQDRTGQGWEIRKWSV